MTALASLTQFVITALLGSLIATVIFKLLSGHIRSSGVLTAKGTGTLSLPALQSLLFSAATAVLYLTNVEAMLRADQSGSFALDAPPELLAAFGASQAVLIGNNLWRSANK